MTEGQKHQAQIDKAAAFILRDIFITEPQRGIPPEWDQSNWSVAIGGLFLCEYFAALKDAKPGVKPPEMQKTLDDLVKAVFIRMEDSGGWGHTPRLKNPLGYVELEIVSNWMLATLGSAQKLGAKVSDDSMRKAVQFIEDCCKPGRGEIGYSPRQGQKGYGSPCRTGSTIFAFASIGQREHKLFPKMIESWRASMGQSDDGHGSVAMGFLGSALGARAAGPKEWQAFKQMFFPTIIADDAGDGSFEPMLGKTPQAGGAADKMAGYTYNTAVYALILQLETSRLSGFGPAKIGYFWHWAFCLPLTTPKR